MHFKIILIHLYIPFSTSLKNKRSIVKSIIKKIHNQYNVSISEIGNQNLWKSAILGLAIIGNGNKFLQKKISHIISFIHNNYKDIEINKIENYC